MVGKGEDLDRRRQGSCEEGFRMCLFMFGLHPGVLFNDSQIGHGVSLEQNHTTEEERERE